jgi:CubicO group peptidase (beta-lactamase class C family)
MANHLTAIVSATFLAAIVFLGRQSCVGQEVSATSSPSEHSWLDGSQQAAIDRLFARPPDSPGYALAIIQDGTFAWAKGYGLANLDDGIPITPETSFHLASVSKQFTAAADEKRFPALSVTKSL